MITVFCTPFVAIATTQNNPNPMETAEIDISGFSDRERPKLIIGNVRDGSKAAKHNGRKNLVILLIDTVVWLFKFDVEFLGRIKYIIIISISVPILILMLPTDAPLILV